MIKTADKLSPFLKSIRGRRIYLDVDGPLTDYLVEMARMVVPPEVVTDALELCHQDWRRFPACLGITKAEMFQIEQETDFLSRMTVLPHAVLLVDLCKRFGAQTVFLSAVANRRRAIWLDQHWPGVPYIAAEKKYLLCSSPEDVLIDDAEHHIAEWPGVSILFPAHTNSLSEHTLHPLKYLCNLQ